MSIYKIKELDLEMIDFDMIPKDIENLAEQEAVNYFRKAELFLNQKIERYGRLETLGIMSVNRKQQLPKSFKKLKNLKEVVLHLSDINHLPQVIGTIPNLEKLTIEYCNIKKLPLWLKNITTLQKLIINKNVYKSNRLLLSKLVKNKCKIILEDEIF